MSPEINSTSLSEELRGKTVLFVVNDPAFFLSHRLNIALAAKSKGMRVVVATPQEPASITIKTRGLEFRAIQLSRWGANPVREIGSIIGLFHLYRALKPDLVHHVTIKPVIYGSLAARLARVPAVINAISGLGQVFTARGGSAAMRLALVKLLYKLAFGHAKSYAIFQNSNDREQFLKAKLLAPERAIIIPGAGVDTDYFSPVPEVGATPPTILFASRLLKEKGVVDFYECARILKQRGLKARFLIAGIPVPGNPGSISSEEFERWKNSGVVECLGHQDDMRGLMREASLVCLPSTYGEGVPKILIEAAACGRAIVTTDWPGCRDICKHGINGLLVAPGNVSELANAVEHLVLSPEIRRKFGEAGREKVISEGFSEQAVVESTLKLYRQLLGAS